MSRPSRRERAARRRRTKERGVALLMVLGALTVLTVLLTELHEETSAELSAALAERDALVAEYNAKSGINLARLLIATEPTIRRTIDPMFRLMSGGKMGAPQIPVWEFADALIGPFNDAGGAAAFGALASVDPSTGKNLGLGGRGSFRLSIVDEDSKLGVNSASRGFRKSQEVAAQLLALFAPPQYNPYFEGRDPDGQFSDRATLCGAIVDWVDSEPDNYEKLFPCDIGVTGPASTGAEDNFYQTIGLDYARKNAPFDSLEELRLVRGVGDDFWATFVDPDPTDPHKRLLTVWGGQKGAVNVNTANPLTLLAILCAPEVLIPSPSATGGLCNDINQIQGFLTAVGILRSLAPGVPIFARPKDFLRTMEGKGIFGPILATFGVEPVQFKSPKLFAEQITNESKVFSLYAEGVVPGNRRETRTRIHAVVDFRTAQPIGDPMLALFAGQDGGGGNTAAGAAGAQAAEASPQAVLAALTANPAGTIIYWRVE